MLNYWFSEALKIILSLKIFGYGIIKVFPIQMHMPTYIEMHKTLGDLTPIDLLWTTFGFGQPYQIFIGIIEVVGTLLILSKKTSVVGLLLLLTIVINIAFMNYTYVISILDITCILLIIILYLLLPYYQSLYRSLILGAEVKIAHKEYNITNELVNHWGRYLLKLFLLIFFSYKTYTSYKIYKTVRAIENSIVNFEIKNFKVINNNLNQIPNENMLWRFWTEKVVKNKKIVTINEMNINKYKTYEITKDTINMKIILTPLNDNLNKLFIFKYKIGGKNNLQLEGEIDKEITIFDLYKITNLNSLNLMKAKRIFFNIDTND